MEKVCAVEDKRRGVLRYGEFMARARTRMVGGGSCTLRCFCSSWSAVTHDGSAMVLENEDKNEDERGMRTSEERGMRMRNTDEDKNEDANEDGGELQLHLAVLLQWLVCSDT